MADQRAEQHHGFRRSREAGPGIYRELELRKGSEDTVEDRRSGAQEGRSGVRFPTVCQAPLRRLYLLDFKALGVLKSPKREVRSKW